MNDLTRDDAIEILKTHHVAHLAVLSDGEPYVTPLLYVILGDELCFRSTGRSSGSDLGPTIRPGRR